MKTNTASKVDSLIHSMSPSERSLFLLLTEATKNQWRDFSRISELFIRIEENGLDHWHLEKNRKSLEILENKILDCLLSDINLMRSASRRSKGPDPTLILQKDHLKNVLLHNRGLADRCWQRAERVKEKALTAENYTMAIASLEMQLSQISLHKDPEEFLRKIQEINDLEYSRSAKKKAIQLYHEYRMKKFFRMNENLDVFLDTGITTLLSFRERMQSSIIDFIVLFFEKEKEERNHRYEEALEIIIELYDHYKEINEPTLLYNQYEIVLEQGKALLFLGHVEEGLVFLRRGLQHLPPWHISSQMGRELLFNAYFRIKKPNKAYSTLTSFVSSPFYLDHLPEGHKSYWAYYRACLYFELGAYKKCMRFLYNALAFDKNNEDLNIKVRLLKIMCEIDTRQFDEADKSLEAFRKYVDRKDLHALILDQNISSFYDVLVRFKYNGYDFNRVVKENPGIWDTLKPLARQLKNTRMDEVVLRYDHWLFLKSDAMARNMLHQKPLPDQDPEQAEKHHVA